MTEHTDDKVFPDFEVVQFPDAGPGVQTPQRTSWPRSLPF